jgi:hypothetical protein
MGISINFGRIYRLLVSKNENFDNNLTNFNTFVGQIIFLLNLTQIVARISKNLKRYSNTGFIRT